MLYAKQSRNVKDSQQHEIIEEIEISSDIAGPGRRKQSINNSIKHYNIAAIGKKTNFFN